MLHVILLVVGSLLPAAAAAAPLQTLLDQVRQDLARERGDGEALVQRFRERRDRQADLLRQARAELQRERDRAAEFERRAAEHTERVAALRADLQARAGELLAVSALVRQAAREVSESLAASLSAARLEPQLRQLRQLADAGETLTKPQLEAFWLALLEGIAAGGRVQRFAAPVIAPDGSERVREVTLAGPFAALSEGRFLRWLADSGRYLEPARQPPPRLLAQARALEQAQRGWVDAPLDPSRGALLGTLGQTPTLGERIEQGGPIGYVILGVGALGLLLVLERWLVLGRTAGRMRRQEREPLPRPNNPLGRILLAVEDWRQLPPEALEHKLDEAILRELPRLRRGLPALALLAGVAPLLGLLGTVAGMIETFQAITLFGTGDPRLMSGGIAEALVTTELGLAAAIPLVLAHGFLAGRSRRLIQTLDQHGAALVARRVESDA